MRAAKAAGALINTQPGAMPVGDLSAPPVLFAPSGLMPSHVQNHPIADRLSEHVHKLA
jgi:hypothetical protein